MRTSVAALLFASTLVGCGGSGGGSKPPEPPPASLTADTIATGLSQPIQYRSNPANANLAYVLERTGKVRLLVSDALQPGEVIDLSGIVNTGGEGGLLGMTFDPNFASNRHFYLHYVQNPPLESRITRYTMSADMRTASIGSGQPIVNVTGALVSNHKGGSINFGTDGYLYLCTGDGSPGNDPQNRAQNPGLLHGKILRIDATGDDFPADALNNYSIPPDNPWLSDSSVRPEVWAMGVRNPFRWTIDTQTGALLVADVGQIGYEEVNYIPRGRGGRNFGWRVREGLHDSGNAGPTFGTTLVDPFLEYDHVNGRSITGGFIYRGTALGSTMRGRYLFADYVSSRLWSLPIRLGNNGEALASSLASATEHTVAPGISGIVSLDADPNGELIVCQIGDGSVVRLRPATAP